MKKDMFRYYVILSDNPHKWAVPDKMLYRWDATSGLFISPQYTIGMVNLVLLPFRLQPVLHFTTKWLSIKESHTPFIAIVNVDYYIGHPKTQKQVLDSFHMRGV